MESQQIQSFESSNGVFLRQASGLVRAANSLDVFVYNLGLISIGIAFCLTQSSGAPNYPGASLPVAFIIGAGLMAVIAFGFWFWAVTIPRSGGIYAFLSRGWSPSMGFALSFVDSFTWLFYNALAATYVSSIGLIPLAIALNRQWPGLPSLAANLTSRNSEFLVGFLALLAGGLVLILGLRSFFVVQRFMFVLGMVGAIVAIVCLGVMSQPQFRSGYDGFAAAHGMLKYEQLTKVADPHVAMNWPATLRLSSWPILGFVGSVFSIAIGGEVQEVRKSQAIGMFGSLSTAAIVLVLLTLSSERVLGAEFVHSFWSSLSQNRVWTPSYIPYFPVLFAIACPWPTMSIVVAAGFGAWAFLWIPATMVYAGRAILAWSLDRVAPASLGYVNDRVHTPTTAIILTFCVNVLFLVCFLTLDY
jgi:amino acid transporter